MTSYEIAGAVASPSATPEPAATRRHVPRWVRAIFTLMTAFGASAWVAACIAGYQWVYVTFALVLATGFLAGRLSKRSRA